MNNLIKTYSNFENENIKIEDDHLLLKTYNIDVKLTKKRRNLLLCLIGEINYKNDIIRYLWGDCSVNNGKKYKQLVFKLRENLMAAGCPRDTIITMYNYGLCLNNNLLTKEERHLSAAFGEII